MTSASRTTESQAGRFLTARWLDLVMLNYEVDPKVLAAHVPEGTELDSWEGKTFVSMVGFRFLYTKLLGLPIPFHRSFDEINLRFYVRRDSAEGPRRGVVFVKEIVPRAAIAWVARRVYNENYVALPTRHDVVHPSAENADRGSASYQWYFGDRWQGLSVDYGGEPSLPSDEAQETFISEHYWGYSRQTDGSTREYKVEHPRWRIWKAEQPKLDCDVAELYGPQFVDFLSVSPSSAFVADGSSVIVRKGVPLGEASEPRG